MTLLEVIEGTQFSDAETAIFATLVGKSGPDRLSLVVVAAAAAILACEATNENELQALCGEFTDVAEELRLHLNVNQGCLREAADLVQPNIQKECHHV